MSNTNCFCVTLRKIVNLFGALILSLVCTVLSMCIPSDIVCMLLLSVFMLQFMTSQCGSASLPSCIVSTMLAVSDSQTVSCTLVYTERQ